MTPEHRAKIANSNILNRLIRHAEGLEDMKQTEVTSGLALLKKVLPDLQSIQIDAKADVNIKLPGHSDAL